MNKEIDLIRDIKSIAYFIEHSKDRKSIELKLSDFFYRVKELQNMISVSDTQKPIIEKLLNHKFEFDNKEYLAGSSLSAVKKGLEVLRSIAKKGIDLNNFGIINLGGGDGTELFTEIEKSKINYGILIEYDFDSVNRFSENQIPFYLRNSSREIKTDVIECDLLDQNKMRVAKGLIQDKNLSGIVVTIHAVLHELSKRSHYKFEMETLFKRVYDLHDKIIFIIREPGIAENWPEKVYISVGNKYKKNLLKILEEINARHFNDNKDNYESFDDGTIYCDKDLAIEALTKLFYSVDYDYEIREQITSISMSMIAQALKASGFEDINPEPFFSESLETNIDHFEVKYKGKNEIILPKPDCFTYTVATKGTFRKKRVR